MIVLLGSPRGILLAYPFSSNEEGSWAYPEELSATRTLPSASASASVSIYKATTNDSPHIPPCASR